MQIAVIRVEFYQSDYIHEIISTASSDQPPPSKCCKLEDQEPLHKVISTSKVTQDVSEILAPLQNDSDPKFILIEGAPGLGKSFLLKEIAYKWSQGYLLKRFEFTIYL